MFSGFKETFYLPPIFSPSGDSFSLKREKSDLVAEGWVAPPDCHIARYRAKGAKYHYWYYQLRASSAIFPKANKKGEFSRFKHLGKAGSQAHIDGVNLSETFT